jgi:hypothetical protein
VTLRFDLRINQGETFQFAIPVLDDDGNPVSLSGFTARGQIRSHAASPTALYEWSATNTNVAFDGNDVVLTVPAASSSLWAFRSGRWDLELVAPDGSVTRLVEGFVIVHPEVTR